MKPDLNKIPAALFTSTSRMLAACLLLIAGLFLTACQHSVETGNMKYPSGSYSLVTVNGAKLPAVVSHGDTKLEVRSGTFRINANGTCSSKTVFSPQSGNEVTREVSATYTRKGSELNMQWEGAGKTTGTIEGNTFTMDNEGMIFAYTKQPAP